MTNSVSWLKPLLASLMLLGQTSCAIQSSESPATDLDVPEWDSTIGHALASPISRSRVALDLIGVLIQLEGYSPQDVSVDVSELQGSFGETLKRVLAAKGYRTALENPAPAEHSVRFALRSTTGGFRTSVILGVGPVSLKRDYTYTENGVRPASAMYIQGAPADDITIDNGVFGGVFETPLISA